MPNEVKVGFLKALGARFGDFRKLEGNQSLFEAGTGTLRIYMRYSKIHDRNQAFYGLRAKDKHQQITTARRSDMAWLVLQVCRGLPIAAHAYACASPRALSCAKLAAHLESRLRRSWGISPFRAIVEQ